MAGDKLGVLEKMFSAHGKLMLELVVDWQTRVGGRCGEACNLGGFIKF